jgi:hypothetical protein
VAHVSKTSLLLAILHKTGLMVHRQVCHGSHNLNSILDPMDVEKAYHECALRYHCL